MLISSTPLPIRSDAHVVPMSNFWAVKMEHNFEYSGVFQTKLEATSYAMSLARMAASSVILHDHLGVIRSVWSYSINPQSVM